MIEIRNLDGELLITVRKESRLPKYTNIPGPQLSYVDLSGLKLKGADLSGADLMAAYLRGTDLCGADLTGAYMICADLTGADLSGASLSVSDLSNANFADSVLTGTCLDPFAPVPETDLSAFERHGEKLICWRTVKSAHITPQTDYSTPGEYKAPVFSVDIETVCHPGIYFATRRWLEEEYPGLPLVKGYVFVGEALRAGGKYRAKRFFSEGVQK